jgi:hypothetical protein
MDSVFDKMIPLSSQKDLSIVLASLNQSKEFAAASVNSEDISMAFQESLLKDWGDGIKVPDEETEAAARRSLQRGSAIFFLSQEAGATKAMLHILSALLLDDNDNSNSTWNKGEFAESRLFGLIVDVLDRFLSSVEQDGHLIDSNVWRTAASDSGSKIALYCTSIASVVIDMLKIIRVMSHRHFDAHKHDLFPKICALVRIQSDEMRILVHDILTLHVAPYLGVQIIPQRLPTMPQRQESQDG